jgi:hypothetical protein
MKGHESGTYLHWLVSVRLGSRTVST